MKIDYSDVEQLLFKGFLTIPSVFLGKKIIFKTVNQSEIDYINILCQSRTTKEEKYKFNCYYTAFSIFSIDGVNMLIDREKNIRMLFDFFFKSTPQYHHKTFRGLNILVKRTTEAFNTMEDKYIFTPSSRYKWRYLKGNEFFKSSYTNIQGTDILGYNELQKNWIIWNKHEDKEEEIEQSYGQAAVIAGGVNNPKAIKEMFENLDKAKEEEQIKRGRKLTGKRNGEEKFRLSKKIETAEDLIEELEKQIKGTDKDLHDLGVEAHEKQVQDMYMNFFKEKEKLKIRLEERDGDDDLIDDLVIEESGLTEEEVIKRLKSKKRIPTISSLEVNEDEMERNLGKMTRPVNVEEIRKQALEQARKEVQEENQREPIVVEPEQEKPIDKDELINRLSEKKLRKLKGEG